MKKQIIFLLVAFNYAFGLLAQSSFRDSVDVLQYTIHLDLSKLQTGEIRGKTDLLIKPMFELSRLKLDLEGLRTDSVLSNGKKLNFSFTGTNLHIEIPKKAKPEDTIRLSVFYGGTPKQDESWGGFFMNKNYAFNYGVGMAATPPNYGRVWYPCIDNFTDRAFYEYYIKTRANHKASCPGLLQSETVQDDGTKIFHWKLNQTIPTYLSSVAVADYSVINDTVQGIERIIPIQLFVDKGSESRAKLSFTNLKKFIHAFEYRLGPYVWDKVGFVSTNFSSGAMEHATNIAYSSYCNGNPACENTLAHELSHHWFGDLVTCASEKDMWLNEGWASYCEAIYHEFTGGPNAYKNYVRENHKNVIIYALNNPETYGALYGMPHSETYGSVVYDKGADVAHTLRGQIGDSIFFAVLKQYFKDYAFKSISVDEFKNYLGKSTNIDLSDFFDFWIYSPGFPHFSINDLKIKKLNGKSQISFNINQKQINSNKFLKSSIIEIGVLDKSLKLHKYQLKQSGSFSPQKLTLDFEPQLLILDPDEKISDAITDEYRMIDKAVVCDFSSENYGLDVKSINSPAFYYCAQHWIQPDKEKLPKNIKMTYDKYWEIKFSGQSDFESISKFYFFNSGSSGGNAISNNQEKLKLLFRENSESSWTIQNPIPQISGRNGIFELKNIKPGQYAIGLSE